MYNIVNGFGGDLFQTSLSGMSFLDFTVRNPLLVMMGFGALMGLLFWENARSRREDQKNTDQKKDRIRLGRSYVFANEKEKIISEKMEKILTTGYCTIEHITPEDDFLNNDFLDTLHDLFDLMQKDSARGIKYAQSWHLKEETIRDLLPKLAVRYQGKLRKQKGNEYETYENWIEWKNTKEDSTYKLKP